MTGSAYKSIYKSLCEIRQLHKWLWEAVPCRVGRDHAQDIWVFLLIYHMTLKFRPSFHVCPQNVFCFLTLECYFRCCGSPMFGPPHPVPGEVAGGAPFPGERSSQLSQVYFLIMVYLFGGSPATRECHYSFPLWGLWLIKVLRSTPAKKWRGRTRQDSNLRFLHFLDLQLNAISEFRKKL